MHPRPLRFDPASFPAIASPPPFRPHPLLRSGHLQTIAGAFWPRDKAVSQADQHVIDLDGGDQTVLHDDRPADWSIGRRCALLIHGLGGCHGSPYLVRVAAKLNARGVRTFRMDMRGCGAGYQLSQHAGHAGRSEDVAASLDCIARLCPGSPVTAVGFSLGGNLVLKLLGERGDETPDNLDSAMAVAPPVDLATCSQNIRQGVRRLYEQTFIRSLLRQVEQRRRLVPALDRLNVVPAPRSMQEFDDRVTAPFSGFADACDYYSQCSAHTLLAGVRLPTYLLSAEDDPLIPVRMFRENRLSPSIHLHLTRHGGHVGYIGAQGVDPDRHWMDWRVVDWICRDLQENSGDRAVSTIRFASSAASRTSRSSRSVTSG